VSDLQRIGIVDYANVAPIVEGLGEGLAPDAVRRGVPSRVADWLATGEVDLAILPAIELARMPGVKVVPGWGIAADGACDSVLLFSSVPLRDVKTCALDASSRTSAGLVRVLLDREGARGVRWLRLAEGSLTERLERADAALLIGDPALRAAAPDGISRHDLAAEWKRHVGLPFVFAAWATRAGFDADASLRQRLDAAAHRGLAAIPLLARREAERTGLPEELLNHYYHQLQYAIGESHLLGLRAYLDEAWRIGLLPARPQVQFWP
jgi:chorismate dehydratase